MNKKLDPKSERRKARAAILQLVKFRILWVSQRQNERLYLAANPGDRRLFALAKKAGWL